MGAAQDDRLSVFRRPVKQLRQLFIVLWQLLPFTAVCLRLKRRFVHVFCLSGETHQL